VDATREANELVKRWQELQEAQVAGDLGRLARLQLHAQAQAQRPGASHEWELLAREAARYSGQLHEEAEERPTIGTATDTLGTFEPPAAERPVPRTFDPTEHYEVRPAPAPEEDVEEQGEGRGRGRGIGGAIWALLVLGYILLQVIGAVFGGDGP